jgi:uncharacterized protein
MKELASLLIKPAGPDCNLACRYCFYLEKAELFDTGPHRMSDAVLQETVRQTMQQGGAQINFGWQGGEPLLMGRDFFQRALRYQSYFGRPGQAVGNGMQTNGTLIDDNWAAFLADAQFLVGLSLDGPEAVHDHYRRSRNEAGTWQRVTQSRDRLLQAGVAVNALIVVNDYSVRFPQEIYTFHKQSGLAYMQFIPCTEPESFAVPAESYGSFLCTLLDLWLADFRFGKPMVSIRWFDSLFYTWVNLPAPECTLLRECGNYVVVEHNGDVYSCDFYVEPPWRLGNVMQDRLTDLLNSDQQNRFGSRKAQWPEKCGRCPWFKHCYAACPRERRLPGPSSLCSAYETFFSYADEKFSKIARTWQKEQQAGAAKDFSLCKRNDPCPCGSGRKYKNCCI